MRLGLWRPVCIALLIALVVVGTSWAQGMRRRGQQNQDPNAAQQDPNQQAQDPNAPTDPNAKPDDQKNEKEVKLPKDPRLLAVYETFVLETEKLAAEYIKADQLEKAEACYAEILRLVPSYDKGKEGLDDVKRRQSLSQEKTVIVVANESWQDTGVMVAAGKPVVISASGNWNFRVSQDVSADGLAIPKDFQDFNLGSLVARIDDGNPKDMKPFYVGSHLPFTARKTGKLQLCMYDADPTDNLGKIEVRITGTFAAGGKRSNQPGSKGNGAGEAANAR